MKYPEIIAEIGVNYYDIAKEMEVPLVTAAKQMVASCKKVGVNIVKFQTYKAEKLAANNSTAYWDLSEEPTRSQREFFSKYDKLTESDYVDIAAYCSQIDVEFMSTPFDNESAKIINRLVSRHKIASADITNFPLIEKIAGFKKPIFLSVGASTMEEIEEAVSFIYASGCPKLTLLHCVLSYPTAFEDANLWKIKILAKRFPDCVIGYSDHTKFSTDVLVSAWILGANVIEKHFTLNKELKGNDHYHAADCEDLKTFISKIKFLQKIYGNETINWSLPCEERAVRNARRGVYLRHYVKKDGKISLAQFDFLRPQLDGINPKELMDYIDNGAVFAHDINNGKMITKKDLQ